MKWEELFRASLAPKVKGPFIFLTDNVVTVAVGAPLCLDRHETLPVESEVVLQAYVHFEVETSNH